MFDAGIFLGLLLAVTGSLLWAGGRVAPALPLAAGGTSCAPAARRVGRRVAVVGAVLAGVNVIVLLILAAVAAALGW